MEFFYENKEFFKVILGEIWGEESRQIKLRESTRNYIHDIKEILEEAAKKGIIENRDSVLLAHAYFSSITSSALYNLIEGKEDKEKTIEMIFEFTLRGLNYSKKS